MEKRLIFKTFTEFCERADDILDAFSILASNEKINLRLYQNYVYYEHTFSDKENIDRLVKDKIWEWLMSYEYEPMIKNDLYSVKGLLKKGR